MSADLKPKIHPVLRSYQTDLAVVWPMLPVNGLLAIAYLLTGAEMSAAVLAAASCVYASFMIWLRNPIMAAMARGEAAKASQWLDRTLRGWQWMAPIITVPAVAIDMSWPAAALVILYLFGCFGAEFVRANGQRAKLTYLLPSTAAFVVVAVLITLHSARAGGLVWIGLAIGFFMVLTTAVLLWKFASANHARIYNLDQAKRELIGNLSAASEEARLSQLQLKAALKAGRTGVWEIDVKAGVMSRSEFLDDLFGVHCTYEGFTSGRNLSLVTPDDRKTLAKFFANIHRPPARTEIVEHGWIAVDGRTGWVRSTAQGFADETGAISRIVVTTTDITARRRREVALSGLMAQAAEGLQRRQAMLRALTGASVEEAHDIDIVEGDDLDAMQDRLAALLKQIESLDRDLVDAVAALDRARAEAERASAAKSQFLAHMSHELRTPLNAIIGYAELVSDELADAGNAASHADLGRIRHAGGHLLGLINEVLDLAKIEAGKMDLVVEPVDAVAIARECLDTITPLTAKRNTICELISTPDAAPLLTDPGRLRQCLLNLLSNAAKFTDNGVIRLTLTAHDVGGARGYAFAVADTGCGIAPEDQARLFQPFTQVDQSRTRAKDGAGIGLVITQKLARMLGGDITLQSAVGKGSTFTLTVTDANPAIAVAA